MQNVAHTRYKEFSRAFRQAPWRVQTQWIAALAAVAVAIIALAGMYLSEASRAATAGRDVQSLQATKADLQLTIDRQRVQIADAKSLTRLEARARELGYVPAEIEQVEYLLVPGYPGTQVAASPAAPAASDAVPDYNESLGSWLAQTLSALMRPGG